MAGLVELLPAGVGDPQAAVSGCVFKIDLGPAGEKIAYVRMFAGTVGIRQQLPVQTAGGGAAEAKATGISVSDHGGWVRRRQPVAGQLGKLWGLTGLRVGDTIGQPPGDRTPTGASRARTRALLGATYLLLAALAFGPQLLGWLAINYAQGHLPASLVSPSLLGQPVVTAILAGGEKGVLTGLNEAVRLLLLHRLRPPLEVILLLRTVFALGALSERRIALLIDATLSGLPPFLVRDGGVVQTDRTDRVLAHLFVHQIHHRGQVHAMLSGTALPPPQLDEFLLASDAPRREEDLQRLGMSEAETWPD